MNLTDRLRIYLDRGFQEDDAKILVLIEETGIAIFSAFPDHFVLFGGAALLLFYESPRFSRDLDLLASVIEARIQSINVKLCTAELRSVLPLALFEELAREQFKPIRDSLRMLFSKWVEEN